jgi:hypothetical protein
VARRRRPIQQSTGRPVPLLPRLPIHDPSSGGPRFSLALLPLVCSRSRHARRTVLGWEPRQILRRNPTAASSGSGSTRYFYRRRRFVRFHMPIASDPPPRGGGGVHSGAPGRSTRPVGPRWSHSRGRAKELPALQVVPVRRRAPRVHPGPVPETRRSSPRSVPADAGRVPGSPRVAGRRFAAPVPRPRSTLSTA